MSLTPRLARRGLTNRENHLREHHLTVLQALDAPSPDFTSEPQNAESSSFSLTSDCRHSHSLGSLGSLAGMPRGEPDKSKIQKVVPKDLTWHSTAEDALHWLSMTLDDASKVKSTRGDKLVELNELTVLVKHLKEHKIQFLYIEDSADDPEDIAKNLLRLSDVDGDEGLNDREFEMLWQL